ncbi:MAG: M20/M25/M40 family metallo-hydrolase [bacterium]|nr:M20/M25/M40 family metallo-hydrolase [bacterium]
MRNNVIKLLNILFKYLTDNTDEKPSQNIIPCLKEVSLFLRKRGINHILQIYPVVKKNNHANLIAFNPKLKGPFVLFQGHIDTVPSANFSKPKINSKTISGRGAVDMKGALAGMINAFISLYKDSSVLKYPPALLITGDEEANSFAGIKNFLKLNAKFPVLLAINGEPSNFEVQTFFRGVLGYVLEKKGEEKHSAYPGKNLLIEEMAPVIQFIIEFLDKSRKIKDKNLGQTIGAITTINSGVKDNQMPEFFRMSFNLRTVKPNMIYKKLFNKIVSSKIHKEEGIKIKSFGFNPTKSNVPQEIKKIIKKSFKDANIKYKESTTTFFTETSLMNMKNIPTIILGPGNPKLSHMDPKKEIIKIRDIKRYSKLLKAIVKSINEKL